MVKSQKRPRDLSWKQRHNFQKYHNLGHFEGHLKGGVDAIFQLFFALHPLLDIIYVMSVLDIIDVISMSLKSAVIPLAY